VLKGAHRVGFEVAAYDRRQPLVIDPVLFYSTYLGGANDDDASAIAVDANGNASVTGGTSSTNFPTTAGAFRLTSGGLTDAFIIRLDPAGAMVYSTYLGGAGDDEGRAIAVDGAGNTYVTGDTTSGNFPTTAGSFRQTLSGLTDAFVIRLNAAGLPVYSTYLGGAGEDEGLAIRVNAAGNAYVTGETGSADFPTTVGSFRRTLGGLSDAFVTRLGATGALVYSTYLGGSAADDGRGIAIDASGNAYVTGETFSTDFPTTAGAPRATLAGATDAFVTKLNATGSALVYSTYLGGTGADRGSAIAVDTLTNPNAYLTGRTFSSNFPTTAGALRTTLAGTTDAFVARLDPTGALAYSTYLGGSGTDEAFSIAVDGAGNAYITGETVSSDFPTTSGAPQAVRAGLKDAFVTKLSPAGALVYSTYLGGRGEDTAFSIAVDAASNAYVAGETASTDFPTTAGAFDRTFNGIEDAFVTKITDSAPAE
jgi:hypothetical protein